MNDKGFSLIEVLIAMAILAIISLPILSSFANAAKVNAKARREENANSVASDIAETFKSMSLNQLIEKYNCRRYETKDAAEADAGGDTLAKEDAKITDYYVFDIDSTGNNGEKFNTKVVLDPSAYTDGTSSNTTNNINSYNMPQYSSLNSDKNILIRDEVYKNDTEALRNLNVSATDAGEKVTKELTLKIKISKNDLSSDMYTQSIEGIILYINKDNNESVTKTFTVRGTTIKSSKINADENKYRISAKEGIKNVYLFYTPFDTTSRNVLPTIDGAVMADTRCVATDKINIIYDYPDIANLTCEDCNIYIIQQQVKNTTGNAGEAVTYMALSRDNVQVDINNSKNITLLGYGTTNLSDTQGKAGPVSIYSNIYAWDLYKKSGLGNGYNGITQGKNSDGQGRLYTMSIEVKYEGKIYTSVSTTKEN